MVGLDGGDVKRLLQKRLSILKRRRLKVSGGRKKLIQYIRTVKKMQFSYNRSHKSGLHGVLSPWRLRFECTKYYVQRYYIICERFTRTRQTTQFHTDLHKPRVTKTVKCRRNIYLAKILHIPTFKIFYLHSSLEFFLEYLTENDSVDYVSKNHLHFRLENNV